MKHQRSHYQYSETLYKNYLREVNNSGILCEVEEPVVAQDHEFPQVLAQCRMLARQHFKICHTEIIKILERIHHLEASLVEDTQQIEQQYESCAELWSQVFEDFNDHLLSIFEYTQKTLIGSFQEKIKRMDYFTVCLFGRTKSGKSTTMEALTCGKGESIGIGAQNTTKKSQQYFWKNLLIVDTPGIDAMDDIPGFEEDALRFADNADLLLFLMPHQILEGDFEKFSRFYKQHKPIVILLNIKKAIGSKDSPEFKMALKYPQKMIQESEVKGYEKRIRTFILEKLQIKKELIPILPIHSQAAFLSHHETEPDIQQQLFKLSRFEELERHLIQEILEYGELFRIKNPYDTVILFTSVVFENLHQFQNELSEQQHVFEHHSRDFEAVRRKIKGKHAEIINSIFTPFFHSKRVAVNGLVDAIFREKKPEHRQRLLEQFFPQEQLKQRLDRCEWAMAQEVEKEITAFFQKFSTELKTMRYFPSHHLTFEYSFRNIQALDMMGTIFTHLGTASGLILSAGGALVASPLLGPAGTLLGISNIWNPIGWGLFAGSIVLGGVGLLQKREMQKKIFAAKQEACRKLKGNLDSIQKTVHREFSAWSQRILEAIQHQHIDVMVEYSHYAKKHLQHVHALTTMLRQKMNAMRRAKFQAMFDRLLPDGVVTVHDVVDKAEAILVLVTNTQPLEKERIQTILTRVEEKSVYLIGGYS